MPRYLELRAFFEDPPPSRAARTRREMLATLAAVRANLTALVAAGPEQVQALFGTRSDELVEIVDESATNLQLLLDVLPPDGNTVADASAIRDLRHDLRGPVGTLRGAAMVLARRIAG